MKTSMMTMIMVIIMNMMAQAQLPRVAARQLEAQVLRRAEGRAALESAEGFLSRRTGVGQIELGTRIGGGARRGSRLLDKRLGAAVADDGAGVNLRRPRLGRPLLAEFTTPGPSTMTRLSSRSAARIRSMIRDGSLTTTGRRPEILAVIRRYGDAAADFIWRNKGALTVASVLTAFLAEPLPFIHGTRDLAEVAVQPAAKAAGEFAREAGAGSAWVFALLGSLVLAPLAAIVAVRISRRPPATSPSS